MIEIPWRTGVNMREFAFYDRPECLRFPAPPPVREAQLDSLQPLGVSLVRFYATHRNVDVNTNLVQVGKALDLLKQRGMQAVVCIGDSIFESGHTIRDDDEYHQKGTDLGHFHKDYWNQNKYEAFYLPYVRLLTEKFGNHSAVLVWELGNELALHPRRNGNHPDADLVNEQDFSNFIRFVDIASHEIRQRSPRKLISTGIINTNQIAPDGASEEARLRFAKKLYGLPNIDAISIHVYSTKEPQDFAQDFRFAQIDVQAATDPAIGKPIYVGELGADRTITGDRPPFYKAEIDKWKNSLGAFSVMFWAFDNSSHDSGMADTLAFARIHGNDYEALRTIISDFRGALKPFFPKASDLNRSGSSIIEEELDTRTGEADRTRFTKGFRVIASDGVRIRSQATIRSDKRGLIGLDTTLMVDPESRTEDTDADGGFVWWEHDRGWSAERTITVSGDQDIFMQAVSDEELEAESAAVPIFQFPGTSGDPLDVNALPLRDRLFTRLPTDRALVFMLQHFGNSEFAFTSGVYDQFFQGLHSGIDLGSNEKDALIPVFAGIDERLKPQIIAPPVDSYRPRGVKIRVGSYVVFYGHMRIEPELVPVGTTITADTQIGHIATQSDLDAFNATRPPGQRLNFTPHLHLEIRHVLNGQTLILNPLLFLQDSIRETIARKNPTAADREFFKRHFHLAPNWTLWGDPFSQPVIRFQQPLIGPRAVAGNG